MYYDTEYYTFTGILTLINNMCIVYVYCIGLCASVYRCHSLCFFSELVKLTLFVRLPTGRTRHHRITSIARKLFKYANRRIRWQRKLYTYTTYRDIGR